MSGLTALALLLLQCGALGFRILSGDSITHEDITEKAILNVTAQVCCSLALTEGKTFTFPSRLTAEAVAAACEALRSSKSFLWSIRKIKMANWLVDLHKVFKAPFHFDDETFKEGRKLILEGLSTVKAANRKHNYLSAVLKLGEILHTLQDFYSHSNWVEMGNKLPNFNLTRANTRIGNIAAKSRATCRDCNGQDCSNNLLDDILHEKILTSGYFSILSSNKPKGKCSHGDSLDKTRRTEPKGGINKDSSASSHGHLHSQAADLAIAATSDLLEEIRGAAGDKEFLQMMGISRGSSKALCFVIDTTESMSEEMAAVKTLICSIIDSKVGTQDEPSLYVLVPFNDPDFGPLIRTTDPREFKTSINSLSAAGGGDFPEMSLSALQLALSGSPPNSEIFVFTDASVKDASLKSKVVALIEKTKSVVNFMITSTPEFRRQIQAGSIKQQHRQMVSSDTRLFRDLAQDSGGQVIEVTKDQLPEVMSIIRESSRSSLVVLLQTSRSPGKAENLTFSVDESLKNVKVYITGTRVNFTLIDPSGGVQNSETPSSVISSQPVGNFQTVLLQMKVGVWEIRMMPTDSYSLKVVGESSVDFFFDFVEELHGASGGFDLIDNRPTVGGNATLMVTLIGSDSVTVTEVALVESMGSGQVHSSVENQGGGHFIARFDELPLFEFLVLVKGQNINSTSRRTSENFQRQSTTSLRASALTVIAGNSDLVLEPGRPELVPFSVMTFGKGGNFSIQATNDQGFKISFPSSLFLDAGGGANGTVNITAPPDTPSGTSVTLTIEVVAPGGADTNYKVLHFIVLQLVTDFTRPVCQLLSLQSTCLDDCSQSTWEISVLVSAVANGTSVDHVRIRQGGGTLSISSENVSLVSYVASCCSPDVQLVVVDQVGNVEICSYSVKKTGSPGLFSTRTAQRLLLCVCMPFLVMSLTSESLHYKILYLLEVCWRTFQRFTQRYR
ncbi:von Willebrand factor A domain-containing protein 7 [Nothobranchius furzeri]|uniref:von Willebrand factor A domain containing 7 n=1 Tax=Nothobranchius furzeri TaxID=105023 RepID=A0A8C6NMB6_NOTFU